MPVRSHVERATWDSDHIGPVRIGDGFRMTGTNSLTDDNGCRVAVFSQPANGSPPISVTMSSSTIP